MSRAAQVVPVTDWFRADTYHPPLPGYYEVRNSDHCPPRRRLTGHRYRYWNGYSWYTEQGGLPSILGNHWTHQWRGRRMWVLAKHDDPLVRALCGGKDETVYVTKASRRSTSLGGIAKALTFETQEKAENFRRRHSLAVSRIPGVKAVQP